MTNQSLLEWLRQHMPEMQTAFSIRSLAVFGSAARDAMTEKSDIDLLVAFDGVASSKRYFGLLFFLEDHLKCPIDLVTEKGLRAEIRPYIEQDIIYV